MADGVLSTLNNNDFWCLDTMLGDCEVYCWPGEAIDRHLAMIVAVSIIYYWTFSYYTWAKDDFFNKRRTAGHWRASVQLSNFASCHTLLGQWPAIESYSKSPFFTYNVIPLCFKKNVYSSITRQDNKKYCERVKEPWVANHCFILPRSFLSARNVLLQTFSKYLRSSSKYLETTSDPGLNNIYDGAHSSSDGLYIRLP